MRNGNITQNRKRIKTAAFLFIFMLVAGLTRAQYITTFAGTGVYGSTGDGGQATAATLQGPSDVVFDNRGNMYICDGGAHRIRKVTPDSIITTIAGNLTGMGAVAGHNGDEIPATTASLNGPVHIAADTAGNIYIADFYNNRIRKITIDGIIHTIAGNGAIGPDGDGGPAVNARLHYPAGVAVDLAGNVYIADTYNHRIRKIDAGGIISTIAGVGVNEDDFGFSGDGGPAINAQLHFPRGIALDLSGNIIFSDQANHRIRKITTAGIISTIAGTGVAGYNGDNILASTAALKYPSGISIDSADNIFIADVNNNRIRKIDGLSGIISTVAGTGFYNFGGDWGLATAADLCSPGGVAVTGTGELYIADGCNTRVRRVGPLQTTPLCVNGSTTLNGAVNGSFFKWFMDNGSGIFNSIDDGPNFSGTITTNLQLINIPGSWYGRKFRCRANGSYFGRIYTISFSNTWTGNADNSWSNSNNWSCNSVPDMYTDVNINGGTVDLNTDATINTLHVSGGAIFTVHPPANLIILH